jgi:CTP:molybdopterin cytidylyltransferase MocA
MPARCQVLIVIGGGALLPDLVVAVLAAGASRRLGRAKQLVPIGGEPLLRRQCRCALSARVGEVVAILGCDEAHHREVIVDLPVAVQVNDEWEEGLAATLRSAVRAAMERQAALLLLACDQYRIIPEDLRTLYDHWRGAPCIPCASRWGHYAGPPAILPIHYHDYVLGLHGDIGARSLLYHSRRARPDEIENPRAAFDLDSPEDMRTAEAWAASQV